MCVFMVLDYHLFTIQRYKIISIYTNIYTTFFNKKFKYFPLNGTASLRGRSRQLKGVELPASRGGTTYSSFLISKFAFLLVTVVDS